MYYLLSSNPSDLVFKMQRKGISSIRSNYVQRLVRIILYRDKSLSRVGIATVTLNFIRAIYYQRKASTIGHSYPPYTNLELVILRRRTYLKLVVRSKRELHFLTSSISSAYEVIIKLILQCRSVLIIPSYSLQTRAKVITLSISLSPKCLQIISKTSIGSSAYNDIVSRLLVVVNYQIMYVEGIVLTYIGRCT